MHQISPFARFAACCAGLLLLSAPAVAATLAPCNANFTACGIQENNLYQLPGLAISGDVILTDPGTSVVSDVFRIFNNIVNTGLGTGLGNLVFLYSADDITLPTPATYSANAVFLVEDPSGVTSFTGNGTTYQLGVPEPQTLGLVGLAAAAMALLALRRSRPSQGGLQ